MKHRTFAAAAMIVTAFGVSVALAAPASATPAASATGAQPAAVDTPLPCGYDGYHGGGQPLYNHCGKTDVVLEVDHMFWQTTYDCVAPGVHPLDQGDSRWAIYGAEWDGNLCSILGPVVGP